MKKIILIISVIIPVSAVSAFTAPDTPDNLRTEGVDTPENWIEVGKVGVEIPNPIFSWDSDVQKYYQVQLSLDSGMENIIWDSGELQESTSTYAVYSGVDELKSLERYYWRVRIWEDIEGEPSGWTTPINGMFEMNRFILKREFKTERNDGAAYAFGDITGNGYKDIAISRYNPGKIEVYENMGGGLFGETPIWESTVTYSNAIALADLNSSGKLDLIVANTGRDGGYDIMLFENTGSGQFILKNGDLATGTYHSEAIAAGDINRNGMTDFVIGVRGDNMVWINDGDFTFSHYDIGGNIISYDLLLADLNSNGYLDLIVANSGENEIYLNTKDLNFPFNDTPDWSDSDDDFSTYSVALIDIEGDGVWDFVAGGRLPEIPEGKENYAICYKIYLNDGEGNFSFHSQTIETTESRTLSSADINRSGYLEFAEGNSLDDKSMVFVNNNGTFELETRSWIGEKTIRVALADFSGSGAADIFRGGEGADRFYLQKLQEAYEKPQEPLEGFTSERDGEKLILKWGPGESSFPLQNQLAYNIKLGTKSGNYNIISGAIGSTDNSGSFWGNIGRSTYAYLNLEPRTYFWRIQAIDGVKNPGEWSDEQIVNTPPLVDWTGFRQWDLEDIFQDGVDYYENRRGLVDIKFKLADMEKNQVKLTNFKYSTSGIFGNGHVVDDGSVHLNSPGGEESSWGQWLETERSLEESGEYIFTFNAAGLLEDNPEIEWDNFNFETSSFAVSFFVKDQWETSTAPAVSQSFYIDLQNPLPPGELTESDYSKDSIVMGFGNPAQDQNFQKYLIFYGTSPSYAGHGSYGGVHYDFNSTSIDYGGASTTAIFGLIEDTTYYINIYAYDSFGNFSSQSQPTVVKTNHPPDIDITSVRQADDGSGLVFITFKGRDNDLDESFYIWPECKFEINGDTEPMDAVTENIKFSSAPLTFGKEFSTYVFVWDAGNQLKDMGYEDDINNVDITITVSDLINEGSASVSFVVDNLPPRFESYDMESGESASDFIEWIWPAAEDQNFVRYQLWYSSVSPCSVIEKSTSSASSIPFDDINKSSYTTAGLLPQTRYWAAVWAYDAFGYGSHTSTASAETGTIPRAWVETEPEHLRMGRGWVEFEIGIYDPDDTENRLNIEFSTGTGKFHQAFIREAEYKEGEELEISTGVYQIGGIITGGGTRTVRAVWNSKKSNGEAPELSGLKRDNVIIRVTPTDANKPGDYIYTSTFTIDNSRPDLLPYEDGPLSIYNHENSLLTLYFRGEDGEDEELRPDDIDSSRIIVSTKTGWIELEGAGVEVSASGNILEVTLTDEQKNWIARRDGEGETPYLKILSSAVYDSYGNPNKERKVEFNKEVSVSGRLTWENDITAPRVEEAIYREEGGDIRLIIKFNEYMDILSFADSGGLESIILHSTSPVNSISLDSDEKIEILTVEKDSEEIQIFIPYDIHSTVWNWQQGTFFLSIPEDKRDKLTDLSGNEVEELSKEAQFKIDTEIESTRVPEISSHFPPDVLEEGGINVKLSTSVYARFNVSLVDSVAVHGIRLFQLEDSMGNRVNNEIEASEIKFIREDEKLLFNPAEPLPGNSLMEVRISKDRILNYFNQKMEEDYSWTFRTRLESDRPNLIRSPSGMVSIEVEPGQFPRSGMVNFTEGIPLNWIRSSMDTFKSAVNKEEYWDNPYKYPFKELTFEVVFSTDGKNYHSHFNFSRNATITVDYSSLILKDISSGNPWDYISSGSGFKRAPVDERTLRLYYLDEDAAVWVPLSSRVDTENKIISAPLRSFSIYTVMGGKNYSTEDAYAYPVPYKPSEIPPGFEGNPSRAGITFTRLPSECLIEIYTVSGRLVNSLNHSDNNLQSGAQAGNSYWYPVENKQGSPVSSGVYIYMIESAGNRKSGKLMIIR